MDRRALLRAASSAAHVSLLLGLGLVPKSVLAAWPENAFHSREAADVERLLFADREVQDSDDILVDAPDIAENGASVPVEVKIRLPFVTTLTLLSETNPFPLLARAHFTPEVEPRLALRVKLGATGKLVAVVEANGELFRATRLVKVTAGGCGG